MKRFVGLLLCLSLSLFIVARAAKDGAAAWVDPQGYKKWVAAQKEKFEAAIKREKADP